MASGQSERINRYGAILERIFAERYKKGAQEVHFSREDIENAAASLRIRLPKNLGDVVYSVRYRTALPKSILSTQSKGREWVIAGKGRGKYAFALVKATRIAPNPQLVSVSIPDSTPEVIRAYALDDEQALLAIVRYNRLIDTFLGLTTYSLQNHLRTTVKEIGQIEVDELYVGLDTHGCHYVIPVQAKGGNDQIGVVQTTQDIRFVEERYSGLRCRPVAVQFMADGVVAMFELVLQGDEIKVVEERHYKLVPATEIEEGAVRAYR